MKSGNQPTSLAPSFLACLLRPFLASHSLLHQACGPPSGSGPADATCMLPGCEHLHCTAWHGTARHACQLRHRSRAAAAHRRRRSVGPGSPGACVGIAAAGTSSGTAAARQDQLACDGACTLRQAITCALPCHAMIMMHTCTCACVCKVPVCACLLELASASLQPKPAMMMACHAARTTA